MTPLMVKGAQFRPTPIMSRNQFDSILGALCFTNTEVLYEDGFFQMRQLEESWNQNIDQQFFSSRINVLNKSMMEWFNKWDPGFMCVGCKPYPFGNEWHTIFCALASIMWRAQIMEVKDMPTQIDGELS